jgi:hypothetical protein
MTVPATATRTSSPPTDDVPTGPQELEPVRRTWQAGDPDVLPPAQTRPAPHEPRRYDPRTSPEFTPFACSEDIDQLTAALAAAQMVFDAVEKNKTAVVDSRREGARSYRYDYADLNEVISATRPHLSANGLVLMQLPIVRQRTVTILGLLTHTSGQWLRTDLPMTIESLDPQSIGTASSYGRRYQQLGLFNLAPGDGEDDDGQRASARAEVRSGRSGPVTMPQRAEVAAPPSPGAPPTSQASPTSHAVSGAVHAPAAVDTRRPGPVPVAARPQAPALITIVAGPIERKTGTGKAYWLVRFSNGVEACTFSTTMCGRLQEGRERSTRYSSVTTSTKGQWTYVDELHPADDDGGAR